MTNAYPQREKEGWDSHNSQYTTGGRGSMVFRQKGVEEGGEKILAAESRKRVFFRRYTHSHTFGVKL